jgi:hypothetical protein
MTVETPSEHLLRSLRITTTARFHAARRLRSHEAWSLWSISFASLFLLVIPLFEPFGVKLQLATSVVGLSQVVASAVILVVSILVNGTKFGERAEKMHSCALDLNALTRSVERAIHSIATDDDIEKLRHAYEAILAKHENHSDTDFLIAQARRAPEYYNIKGYDRIRAKLQYYGGFSLYVALLFSELLFIYVLLTPISAHACSCT